MRGEYHGTVFTAAGRPLAEGSPAWQELRRRMSAWWGAALAWQRDHPGGETAIEGGVGDQETEVAVLEPAGADKRGAA